MASPTKPSAATFRIGLTLVVIGTLAALITLVPLVTAAEALPLIWYLLAMLAPLGLGVMLFGLWQASRRRRAALSTSST